MTGKLVYYLLLHSIATKATLMGRTGAATSMPIKAITTVSAVSDPGLTSIHWILLLPVFYTLCTHTL